MRVRGLHFSEVLWPDFRDRELFLAIEDFQRRERRFGLTGAQLASRTWRMGALDKKNRQNLVLRVASAAVLFPLAVWITYLGGLPFAVLAGGAAAVAAFELVVMFGTVGAAEVFGIAVAGAIPFVAAWEPSGNLLPGGRGSRSRRDHPSVHAVGLPALAARVPRAMAVVALSWLYCGVLLASVVGLRLRFDVGWVILAFVVTWGNDTFAYFTEHVRSAGTSCSSESLRRRPGRASPAARWAASWARS